MTPAAPNPELLQDVMSATGLPEAVVKGVCGQLAASGRYRHDRATMIEVAQTWGQPFEIVQQLAGLRIDDLRAITDGVGTSALLNCGVALERLAKALGALDDDENALGTAKVLSGIASQQAKIHECFTKTNVPGVMIQNNYGVEGIKALMTLRTTEKSAAERLRERGVVIDV